MRISDWSSDVCSSDLMTLSMLSGWATFPCPSCHILVERIAGPALLDPVRQGRWVLGRLPGFARCGRLLLNDRPYAVRSEEHTSELQSLMRISYAVFCLKKKNINKDIHYIQHQNLDHN